MKAVDYVDKFHDKLENAINEGKNSKVMEVMGEIILAFVQEADDLMKQRKVFHAKSYAAIYRELFQKYAKFCRLMNERLGEDLLLEDGLKKTLSERNPGFGELLDKYRKK